MDAGQDHGKSKKQSNSFIKQISANPNSQWQKEMEEITKEYDIDREYEASKNTTKTNIEQISIAKFLQTINEEAKTKSKTKHWTEHKTSMELGIRPKHLDRLNRKECSALIRARTRMLQIKENHLKPYPNQGCRLCKSAELETQLHIFQECPEIAERLGKITYKSIFENNDMNTVRNTANHIIKVSEIIENTQDA